jgi:NAD(P)-dependent dehydrogenase (short-subunit alcohol dehydrogenase family)
VFEREINTNFIGTVYCLAPLINRINQGGRLAIISSAATFVPFTRAEAYGASKAALDYLTRSLAVDLQPHGIDVSLIRPGFVDTPLTRKNDFAMPGLISMAQASAAIRRGLARGRAEICFPLKLIIWLRLSSWLPNSWWRYLATKMAQRQ